MAKDEANAYYTSHGDPACLRSMDIWYHITVSLDPPDILALRTVCTSLLRLCIQRSVWLQAARTMCRSHGLFLPSFPFESMSVKELTRLALSPFSFSRLLSMEDTGRLPEKRSWSFNPRLKNKDVGLRSLHLLPGGRYLITYQNDDVCLWDLGYGPVFPSLAPLACLHVEGIRGQYHVPSPCPTEDGKGVSLILLYASRTASTLAIYDIYPGVEEPKFRCTTSWQVPFGSYLLGYSSRYAVMYKGTEIKLYTVNDVSTGGPRCDPLYWSRDVETQRGKGAILGDTFLLSDRYNGALNVFSIPRALASAATKCQPILSVPCRITHDGQVIEDTLYTSEWTASSGNTFFALIEEVSDTINLELYRMADLASLSESLLPSAIPVKVGEISLPHWYRLVAGANLQRTSSGLVVIGITNGEAVAVAKITMPNDGLPALSIKTLMDEAPDRFGQEVSLCVATGRLVVAIPPNESTDWVIWVHDYLSQA
ncbi:hypothetical protein BKA70DRAFT_1416142 [Coprinopsis sp. MPI-PUGE-AT-0042]|nr:hypothetical protein BKA70DRAFT_1416142 [Coprinopsis sp. MPI-PUGE-AT-0042]